MSGAWNPKDDTGDVRWRRWTRAAGDGVIIGAPTAALLELAAQNPGTGLGVFGVLAALASFGGLSYWRIGRAAERVDDDFRGRNPMRGAAAGARRTAAGAVAALAVGAAGAGVAVPAVIPEAKSAPAPVAQVEQHPQAQTYSERLQVALNDLESAEPGATKQLRKVSVYDEYVEILYFSNAGGERIYVTQTGTSREHDGPATPGTFTLSEQEVSQLDGMLEQASEDIEVSHVEYQAETELMAPNQAYDVLVTMWNADPDGAVDRIEGTPQGEVSGYYELTTEWMITQRLRLLGQRMNVDWYTAAYSEFGVTGLNGKPTGQVVTSTNTAYARVAAGPTVLSGTIWEQPGRYPTWVADQTPIPAGGVVAMEPFLDETFPAILGDHQQRTGASEADMPSFAMRVSADPNDPLYGVVVDYYSIPGAKHRYTLDGQYLGPVQ